MSTTERREEEREARWRAIVDAAERLFASLGPENVTVDDVASAARLAKGTLYLYFKNKVTLTAAVSARASATLADMLERAMTPETRGIGKVYAGGLAYYEFARKYPLYFRLLAVEDHSGREDLGVTVRAGLEKQTARIRKIMADAIRSGIEDGTIRRDAEPGQTALFLLKAMEATVRAATEEGGISGSPLARDEFVYFSLDMLKHALENTRESREQ